MSTPEACIARAEEAERLAALVSYDRDRVRLKRQAAEWRDRAAQLQAAGPPPESPHEPAPQPTWRERLSRAWRRRAA